MSSSNRLRFGISLVCLSFALAVSPISGLAEGASNIVWPHAESSIHEDAAMEARIKKIVSGMTLRQKIGQMTQVEIKAVTPQEVRDYYLGSVLNGGGSWPAMNKHATPQDWVNLSDSYYKAAMSTDMKVKIPLLWGTDAVHGHSNVVGATIFPHNIGLGAANDPELMTEIGKATSTAVRATGINWSFAPTLAVVQNPRWGRTYESFSSDPKLVRTYAKAYVEGLQGDLSQPYQTVASAKHFIGDGGTTNGVDQGINNATEADLLSIHAQGYYGAIEASVQTIMVSYNSWDDTSTGNDQGKLHGSRYLLTDVLKDQMGFDGFLISDWNAIGQVKGCTDDHCAAAINAGVDMIMVPFDWKKFIDNTEADVKAGIIPMSRIDDAVTRILRVKMRAGLFSSGAKPSKNPYAGKVSALEAKDLGRRAVRESLVLLKNNDAILPIKPGKRILVVGKSADNLVNQSGGWSITWQGDNTDKADFPNGDSVLSGIIESNKGGDVVYSMTGEDVDVSSFDVVIAVVGETPYAEGKGDIKADMTLMHTQRFPEDLRVLQAVANKGVPVVTVLESGRPLYVPDLLNLSDSFVAAWLPGTEGKGVADVLFAKPDGLPAYDFRGRLQFNWPDTACPTDKHAFSRGYGLSYGQNLKVGDYKVVTSQKTCPF